MLWAEHVARNTAGSRDDVFREVRRQFDDAELVELTGVCGLFAQSNRFQDSLKLPIEEQREVDKIRQSVRVDSARLKSYVERLLTTWPGEFPTPQGDRAHPSATAGTVAPEPAAAEAGCRIALPGPDDGNADTTRYFRAARDLLGGLPNFARVWGRVPHLGKLVLPLHVALTYQGAGSILPGGIKALAALRVSHVNAAGYSTTHRTALARRTGAAEAQLAALTAACTVAPAGFSPRELAAIAWAEHVARNTAKHHDEVFDELQARFTIAEIVELTALCAFATKMDRIHNALRVPLESGAEIAALYRSDAMDPSRLRAYLQAVVDDWPARLPEPDANIAGAR